MKHCPIAELRPTRLGERHEQRDRAGSDEHVQPYRGEIFEH